MVLKAKIKLASQGLLFIAFNSYAQIEFSPNSDVRVIENDIELLNPFAGGMNSPQFSTIDIDLDGDEDLMTFDRSDDKLSTFLNEGDSYRYAPQYEYLFPEGIQNWVLARDYNCDGRKDLIASSSLGMRVFENTSTTLLSFELVADPILTQGTSSQVNLAVNNTDIPGIADVDGDGDLDILVYNFATGGFIEFHQNMSIENNGDCSELEFVRVTRTYGDFEECFCNEFAFNGDECLSGGRILHTGGRSILPLDNDGDGDMELVIGQEGCLTVNILENKGNNSNAVFDSFSDLFPETDMPLNIISFPVPYYEDVTFDGIKDIIVGPNVRTSFSFLSDERASSYLFENTGSTINPVFTFRDNRFLQDDMIETGSYSFPAFIDIDGDQDDDLIIGSRSTIGPGVFQSTIHLYTKTAAGLVLINEDLSLLSLLNAVFINPSIKDINSDGRLDLVITYFDPIGQVRFSYLPDIGTTNFSEFSINNIQEIAVPTLQPFDDPELYDQDGDGDFDLFLARSNGILEYYINTGDNTNFNFVLEDNAFLDLRFDGNRSNLNLTNGDIDEDGLDDLLTTDRSGEVRVYSNIRNFTGDPVSEIVQLPGSVEKETSVLGRFTSPAFGRVDGKNIMVFGNIRGGLNILESTTDSGGNGDELELSVFPSPSNPDKIVKFFTPNEGAQLEIFNISGSLLVGPIILDQDEILSLNLTNYRRGLYIARIKKNDQTTSLKFVLGNE